MNVDAGILLTLAGVFACIFVVWLSKSKGPAPKAPDWTKLSLVANKTEHAVLLIKPDGVIQWVNPAFAKISGWDGPEAAGKQIAAVLLGSLHSPKAVEQIKSGLSGRKGFGLELLCAQKDGPRYWFSLNLTPILDEQERLLNFVALGTDITTRKKAEDELVRANRRNEMFLNAAGEGIFGLDLQGAITFVNPA